MVKFNTALGLLSLALCAKIMYAVIFKDPLNCLMSILYIRKVLTSRFKGYQKIGTPRRFAFCFLLSLS